MISRPTVFVLGAGASMPYRYPSGKELVEEVLDDLLKKKSLFSLCRLMEFSERDIRQFAEALRFSGDFSIDAFLERNIDFVNIGKVVIYLTLVKREQTSELFSPGADKWYGALVNELKTPHCAGLKDNKVSFLTFNYDRSFDHYLFTAVKNSYGLRDDRECFRIVKNIPIIHLHGQIGKLPYQADNMEIEKGREYGNDHKSLRLLRDVVSSRAGSSVKEAVDDVRKESQQIRIIHEKELDDDDEFRKAQELLLNAERIYFLGFGYNDENLRRLRIAELPNEISKTIDTGIEVKTRSINGTSHGIGQAKKAHIRAITNSKIRLDTGDYKVLEFIREMVELD